MNKLFALCDCNNFYVSCERVFRPNLINKPVVVLSNNDGCIVARSNEIKKLKIKIGTPIFKIQEEIKKYNIEVFSSNYALYGDMSNRVMQTLASFSKDIEIYSIDEAFLDFTNYDLDITQYAHKMVNTTRQWTGIPISIGIAPSKTLAKVANFLAKKELAYKNVFNLNSLSNINDILESINVEDIWGIGPKSKVRLNSLGIYNALELKKINLNTIKKLFNINLYKTVQELNGESVIDLDTNPNIKKQIIVSRSFGEKLTDFNQIASAVTNYASRGGEKLRQQNSLAQAIIIFVQTNFFNNNDKQYSNSITLPFAQPTSDSTYIVKLAIDGLKKILKKGFKYKKAGIILLDVIENRNIQIDLFNNSYNEKSIKRMQVLDSINSIYGQGTIRFATEGFDPNWRMLSKIKSPSYTTRWNELLKVR